MFNEENTAEVLIDRLEKLRESLKNYNLDYIFIDDGSKDNTLPIIKFHSEKNKHISYISLSRNFGKEIAMIAGLDQAKNADAVVIIDADLQDPPELIPKMIKYWEEGYDDVYAKRRSRDGETYLKKKTSELFYKVLQTMTDIPIQQDTGDFRLLSRRAVHAITEMRESQRYTKGMFSWVGFKKKEILYDRDPRIAGETKWSYLKLFNLAVEGITSFTTAPLRVASVFGIVVSGFAFLYICYLLIRPLFGISTGAGYSSIMAVVLFLGGVQLICLGIIGEYIGRIFNEAKHRPLYYIEDSNLQIKK